MIARSTVTRSSRTFPGHGYARSASIASGAKSTGARSGREAARERLDIRLAPAGAGNLDHRAREAPHEIAPFGTSPRGGEEAHARATRGDASDAVHLPVLERVHQPGLFERRRERIDVLEEDAPSVGRLERPGA